MVNDTHHHEESRLEQRMRDGVKHRRYDASFCSQSDARGQQTQLAYRGIGHQPLHIGLLEGEITAYAGRYQAARHQQAVPGRGVVEDGTETQQKEYACLDHCRSMQIGADRSDGGHGIRQPHVERELGSLRESSQCDQHSYQRRETGV